MTPSRALKTVAALGMLSSAVWASTYAAFSDTVDAPTGTFTAGTLKLEGVAVPAFTTLMTAGNMKPGDAVYAPLTLTSTGTLAATYGMTTEELTGALPLTVSVKSGVALCSAAGFGQVGSSAVITDQPVADAAFAGRTLAAVTGTETLCVKVELPSTADNTAQGQTAKVTFRFTAAPTAS